MTTTSLSRALLCIDQYLDDHLLRHLDLLRCARESNHAVAVVVRLLRHREMRAGLVLDVLNGLAHFADHRTRHILRHREMFLATVAARHAWDHGRHWRRVRPIAGQIDRSAATATATTARRWLIKPAATTTAAAASLPLKLRLELFGKLVCILQKRSRGHATVLGLLHKRLN